MQFTTRRRAGYAAPALGLALMAAVSACSSGSSSSSSTVAALPITTSASSSAPAATSSGTGSSSGAVAQITQNWQTFFSSGATTSQRENLLENGAQFAPALTALGSIPVTSKVDNVALDSSTRATVTYDLDALGTTVASAQKGSSVLQNGTWKIGDDVLCGLLTQGKAAGMVSSVPSVCNSVS